MSVNLQSFLPGTNDNSQTCQRPGKPRQQLQRAQFVGLPFAIVFVTTAACQGEDCNSQAVVFGNHQAEESSHRCRLIDIGTVCPDADVVGCPETDNLADALTDWLDDVGQLSGVLFEDATESSPVVSPTFQPTTAPTISNQRCI